jgi:hypothetical protein
MPKLVLINFYLFILRILLETVFLEREYKTSLDFRAKEEADEMKGCLEF